MFLTMFCSDVYRKEDLKRNSSNIEEKIRDFEARRGKSITMDVTKLKQQSENSKSPRTSLGRPIKFSFKSSYSSELDTKIDDRTLPVGTKYSSKDECYVALVPEVDDRQKQKLQDSLKRKFQNKGNVARETAVCIIDSVLDSAKNIVETRLIDKDYKENIADGRSDSQEKRSPSNNRLKDIDIENGNSLVGSSNDSIRKDERNIKSGESTESDTLNGDH
jgi:hypothetical protein